MNYKPNYKLGDMVVLKPRKLLEKERILDSGLEEALAGTDRVVKVVSRDISDTYTDPFQSYCITHPNLPGGRWIHLEAILGYAFEWGEAIEVSDDGEVWYRRKFGGYGPDCVIPIKTYPSGVWTFARPLQPKPQEIEVKVLLNGKEVPPSTLSCETWNNLREKG